MYTSCMNEKLVPKYAFFVSGSGKHKDRLQAFDRALLSAGPIAHNLVTVSSILPAGCKIVSPGEGFAMLTPGQITFAVMAKADTNQEGEYASAAVGVVSTKDPQEIGYISEYHGNAHGKEETGEIAKKLAIEMYETKLGVKREELDLAFHESTTASVQCTDAEEWACAVALCIFAF